MIKESRTVTCDNANIDELRKKHSDGLRFVVGDVHNAVQSLCRLIGQIGFDDKKDRIYFVGDYVGDGSAQNLMDYMSNYVNGDYTAPGFHLIRGNHERDLYTDFPLTNMPDVTVLRGEKLLFFIAHAGMPTQAFNLICADIDKNPNMPVYNYSIDPLCACYDAPLRQVVWSMRGLYSPWSHEWVAHDMLLQRKACIIHGHTPYCYLASEHRNRYGMRNAFWNKQLILFSEDMQSFNIDANVKGVMRHEGKERGLSCICLDAIEDAADEKEGLTLDAVCAMENGVSGVPYIMDHLYDITGDAYKVNEVAVSMKRIIPGKDNIPYICD